MTPATLWILSIPGLLILAGIVVLGWWVTRELDE